MIDNRTPAERRRDGLALQRIEGNPLDAADIAMFEMFDREGYSVEQRLAFLGTRHKQKVTAAAE